MEDNAAVERDKQRAEVFDALGHPTRIAILKALSGGSLGFADLKKKTGIQSSGHLQHHLNKLGSLVGTDQYSRYCLSEAGKDALLTVGTVEHAADSNRKPTRKWHLSFNKIAALILIGIVAGTLVTAWTYYRIGTHQRWATEFRVAQQFYVQTDDHDIDGAYHSIGELVKLDQDHSLELSRIDSFLTWYRNPDLNDTGRAKVDYAFHQIGHKVIDAYASILNYTSINDVTGPPFWYFGPSSPDESMLQDAANIAVSAESIIKNN
jgi:DNA-binding HxlR family transcriptional regulator